MYSYLAEFIGSAVFVYVLLVTGNPLAIGAALALVLLINYSYHLSDLAINPTVTVVMAAAGKILPREVLPYCAVQILGGLVALEIYKRYR